MAHYAAFDVSDKETAIHVLDAHGRLVWKGKRPSEPEALTAALRRHAPELERVGLETGQLAPWLYHSLKALGVPVVCLDARHARAATALQRNKTDARDAETLAQLVRMGWYREARVKGWAPPSHLPPSYPSHHLSNQSQLLKTFGLRAGGRAGGVFRAKVREQVDGRPEVAGVAEPLLAACARAHRRPGPQADRGRQGRRDLPPADDLPRRWSRPASARPWRRPATSNVHGRSAPTSACSAHQRRTQASPPGRDAGHPPVGLVAGTPRARHGGASS